MTRDRVRSLLAQVADGTVSPDKALQDLAKEPFESLDEFPLVANAVRGPEDLPRPPHRERGIAGEEAKAGLDDFFQYGLECLDKIVRKFANESYRIAEQDVLVGRQA